MYCRQETWFQFPESLFRPEINIVDSRLLWGAVEMLMLEVISHGPTYGYEIAQTVGGRSQGYFELKEGSLYPALHRLESQKLVKSWGLVVGTLASAAVGG